MTTLAATDVLDRARGTRVRLRLLMRAVSEYFGLLAQAQRTWLFGTAAGVGAAWLNILPGVTVPGWAVAAIMLATIVTAQFQVFLHVREERNLCLQAHAMGAVIDDIAVLRTRETELRNRAVRDAAAYEAWKAELVALRAEIHARIAKGISRAEAETFHTIGNLRHAGKGGINDEHNLLLAVATRDLDHLAELIHGHTRFND
jgi:hypothetical protein